MKKKLREFRDNNKLQIGGHDSEDFNFIVGLESFGGDGQVEKGG